MKNVRADHYIISKIVKNNSRILDIGCADGQLLHLLQKKGYSTNKIIGKIQNGKI